MAELERAWFRCRFAGLEVPNCYQTDADADADFNGAVADQAVVDEAGMPTCSASASTAALASSTR